MVWPSRHSLMPLCLYSPSRVLCGTCHYREGIVFGHPPGRCSLALSVVFSCILWDREEYSHVQNGPRWASQTGLGLGEAGGGALATGRNLRGCPNPQQSKQMLF